MPHNVLLATAPNGKLSITSADFVAVESSLAVVLSFSGDSIKWSLALQM